MVVDEIKILLFMLVFFIALMFSDNKPNINSVDSFGHLIVSELERVGLPMIVAQFLLGHSNLSVTELYNDVSKDESMEQFGDFFSGKVSEVKKRGLGDL
jgi:hypothetical protein